MLKWKGRALSTGCACCVEPLAATGVSRRQLLAGGAALGLVASGLAPKAFAQAKPDRIDVHHHVVPPTWLAAMDLIGRSNPPLLHWSMQKTLDDMDKGGVATSIVSPTTPQSIPLGVEAAVRIARESNEYGKKLMADHPGRFGVFATLPLPHIDESLKEIAYAFDTLKVDGIGMMTNYGDKWLGYATSIRSGRNSTGARRRSTPIRPTPIAASTWCRACRRRRWSGAPIRRARSST